MHFEFILIFQLKIKTIEILLNIIDLTSVSHLSHASNFSSQ